MKNLPVGTITFLFSDIEGNTPLWEHDPQAMATAMGIHNAVLHEAIESNGGMVTKIVGDEFQAAFSTAPQALMAAIQAQRGLLTATWNELGRLKVRMGLHTGEAHLDDQGDEYAVSHTKNRGHRVMEAAHGGQILLSQESADLCARSLPPDVYLKDLGEYHITNWKLPEHFYQIIAPDLPMDFPPLRTQAEPKHNLPAQLTSFIGRKKEIKQVGLLLQKNRLVTLTGTGGVGKTRLALRLAEVILGSEWVKDGVWWVELAPISSPTQMIQAVAGALGLQGSIDMPIRSILTNYLKNRSLLLVLDNCEHLIEACAELTDDLVHACPKLTILTTSREALRVSGEVAYHVPSLSVPDLDRLPSIDQLVNFEAAHLFAERASASYQHFQISPHNARAVAQICQKVDGIPLAIELAAARVSMMSLEQINNRLDHSFQLLTGGSRTTLPRHQTLRASIDWSYSLLSETERLLLTRLSIFTGGWTLEAAEQVCGFDGIEEIEVLDILTSLVNKCLVNLVDEEKREPDLLQPEVEIRYRMLETIRQFAFERLSATAGLIPDPVQIMKQRHLHYYCSLAERTQTGLRGPQQALWMGCCENEWGNYRAALDWSINLNPTGHLGDGSQIIFNLMDCWYYLGYAKEALVWIDAGLTHLNGQSDTPAQLLSRTWWAGGVAHWSLSNYSKSIEYIEKAIFLLRQSQPSTDLAEALAWYAMALHFNGEDPGRALTVVTESVAISRQLTTQYTIAFSLYIYGVIIQQIDPQAAVISLKESLALLEKSCNLLFISNNLRSLGMLAAEEGDLKQAKSYLQRSLDIDRRFRAKYQINWDLSGLGDLAYSEGQYSQMELYFQECLVTSEKIGFRQSMVWSLHHLGVAARRQGQVEASLEFYRKSISMAQEFDFTQNILENLAGLAGLALERGQVTVAVKLLGLVAKQGLDGFGPITLAEFDWDCNAAREMLSEAEFQQAWEAGAQMTVEQALGFFQELAA